MDLTTAIHLLCACPVGGTPGETTLGDAIERLHRRNGVRVALAAVVELIDCGYLEHQSHGGVAYVAADTHWHETARRTLADHPNVLQDLGVALPLYRCCVSTCPGLPYRASEHPHPCVEAPAGGAS